MSSTLEAAITRWRGTRSAADAERVDVLALDAASGWEPPTARTAVAFHAAWLALAADVVHRGWAAEAVLTKLPAENVIPTRGIHKETRQGEALAARFYALAAGGPDPRVARSLVRMIGRWSLLLQFQDLARAACTHALVPSLDDRSLAELHQLGATCNHLAQRRYLGELLATLPAAPVLAAPPADDLSSLWAQVRVQPDDDTPRRVLADALQSRGDPRGELIALQLTPGADPARIQTLLKTHGLAWASGVARFTERVQFARGCVTRIELASAGALNAAGWTAALDEPELATVEDVLPGTANATVYARMLGSPQLRAIRRVSVYDRGTAVALAALPPQLDHVAYRWMRGNPGKPFARDVLPALARQPRLRALTLPIEAFDVLAASELFGRLRVIAMCGPLRDVLALWPNLAHLDALTYQRAAELPPCSHVRTGERELTLSRTSGEVTARAAGDAISQLAIDPKMLPAGIGRLVLVDADDAAVATIRKALRKVEVTVVTGDKPVGAVTIR